MDRIVVVANPAASQFTGGSHRDVMGVLHRQAEVHPAWPGSAAEATEISAKAAADGVEVVAAMGGDGIVHHVAQGLIGTDTALAIIPAGTTNVVARLLKIPSKPVKAARLMVGDRSVGRFGVARMTLERGATETTHHAVFACGFGLDAAVVQQAEKDPYRKYRFGAIHYASSALTTAMGQFPGRKPNLSVRAGDRTAEATTALVQFREVYTYFGRITIRFNDRLPDPMSTLVMGRLARRRVPRIATALLAGRDLATVPEMSVWEHVEEVTVQAELTVEAQADGEPLGLAQGGRVEWLPGALTIVIPSTEPSPVT